ncbi:MFS transporter [Acidisphaera sp. S103]|uniref:MFS transporter n=1 Tax=Acidisphaera sp. S103 TaxID=1747223 RepID=UPI00131C0B0B|nr:MFS transporter [Acidisphaera sp. S103]
MDDAVERSAIRKIYWRLLPIAIFTYLLAYIDRINVGFAALTMRGDLHMSATQFGFASGIFFWGYFIFEVPSNVIMEKVGARIWIARIMISWGVLAAATAFVTGTNSFAVLRFLLGVAEAGFLPGLILYFTYWLPGYHHARVVSGFLVGLPIAVALGSPVSTALLSLDGWLGLHGWQHMYLFEGLPTVLIGFAVLFILTDRPAQAKFLTQPEKDWLSRTLEAEKRTKEAKGRMSLWQALVDFKVLMLALNYLGIVTASLGMLIFIPQIIKSLGVTSNMTVGWLTMIPYIAAGIVELIWGQVSDRMNERRWNLFTGCMLSAIGLVIAGLTMGTWWALFGMTIAACGFYGSKGPFWAMPGMFLTGPAAAAGIAWINSIGNLGGFFGPWYVGFMKDATGSYSGGLYGLALFGFAAAVITVLFLDIPNPAPVRTQVAE